MHVIRSTSEDSRGGFSRVFCSDELRSLFPNGVAQTNLSTTVAKGTVRGLHFQNPPDTDSKLVFCISGEIVDFIVDLRSGSSTRMQWLEIHLSALHGDGLYIPKGFAHGFQTLAENTVLLYFHDTPYAPQNQGGVHPFDPTLKLPWPIPVANLSERDQCLPTITDEFLGVPGEL
jgi:dTDP-4-dehydrorhamnose 3,5-epimerase